MPPFDIQNRFSAFSSGASLHGPKRPHMPAFFGGNSGSFGLSAVDVLISRFKARYKRQYVLGSKSPGDPSQNPNTPAGLVRRRFSAIVLKKSCPSDSVPSLGGC